MTQLPTGHLAGEINFFETGTPLVERGFYQATPSYLTINCSTACVVGTVTHVVNWTTFEPPPQYVLITVTDVPGGLDMFGVVSFAFPIGDPAFWCSIVTPWMQITSGDFTINS